MSYTQPCPLGGVAGDVGAEQIDTLLKGQAEDRHPGLREGEAMCVQWACVCG